MNYTIQEPLFINNIIRNIRTNQSLYPRDQYSQTQIFFNRQSMTTIQTIVPTIIDNTLGDITKNPLAYSLLQALIIVIFIYLLTITICCISIQRYKKRLYKRHPNITYDTQYNDSGCCLMSQTNQTQEQPIAPIS